MACLKFFSKLSQDAHKSRFSLSKVSHTVAYLKIHNFGLKIMLLFYQTVLVPHYNYYCCLIFTATGKTGNRWSMITIRVALAIFLRSPAAYEALKSFKLLQLPSRSTLQMYTSAFMDEAGNSWQYYCYHSLFQGALGILFAPPPRIDLSLSLEIGFAYI